MTAAERIEAAVARLEQINAEQAAPPVPEPVPEPEPEPDKAPQRPPHWINRPLGKKR